MRLSVAGQPRTVYSLGDAELRTPALMARGTGFASCRLRTQSRQRLAACKSMCGSLPACRTVLAGSPRQEALQCPSKRSTRLSGRRSRRMVSNDELGGEGGSRTHIEVPFYIVGVSSDRTAGITQPTVHLSHLPEESNLCGPRNAIILPHQKMGTETHLSVTYWIRLSRLGGVRPLGDIVRVRRTGGVPTPSRGGGSPRAPRNPRGSRPSRERRGIEMSG